MTGREDAEYYQRLVDEDALAAFFEDRLGPAEHFEIERHEEGHSNETLFVDWGERNLVVRRPPPGETADTAHDVLREYHVMDALQDTAVPIPATVASTDDHSIIGSDFYVMERLDGTVFRDDEVDMVGSEEDRRRVGAELVDTLVAIHDLDYEGVGLGEFGRPDGFSERQVERWSAQIDWASDVTAEERAVPELDRVGQWLLENAPSDHPSALVHGDYRLENVMYGPESPPELVGVFDWEMSTLGDPLTDLGWVLLFWHDGDEAPPVPELMTTFTSNDGYLTRTELVDRYEAGTGLSFDNDRFYRTLAIYKLAGLGEMFFRRHLEGNSDDPLYPVMRERVPALAERATEIIDGNAPL